MERRLLSRRCGDFSGQYYGAPNVKDDRHCVAVLGCCKGHGKRDSERMHLIYEVVEFVGRWSMIDVFVIAVLSALVRMGGLIVHLSGNGCINVCFSRHNDNVFCYDV